MEFPATFWENVTPGAADDECWLWSGTVSADGYGRFSMSADGGRQRRLAAHRVAYELEVGPIPEGLTLDHVRARGCVHRHCVNPAHLEPVTGRENILRGDTFQARNAAKTHCPQGHPYSGENLRSYNGTRYCLTCKREATRRYRAAHN